MGFFDAHHPFAAHSALRELCASPALVFHNVDDRPKIDVYHESVLNKLWGTQLALDEILKFDALGVFKSGRKQDDIARDLMTITNHLDTLFVNAVSAVEMASQEVNVCYGLGLSEEEVSVREVRARLQATRVGTPIEHHYRDLLTPPQGQWFVSLNDYRRCTLHRKTTVKEVRGEFRMPVSSTGGFVPVSMRVILPNDPLPLPPIFDPANEVEMAPYCEAIFRKVLDNLNALLCVVEMDIKVSTRIPIP
jgi:hypothetical protein